MVLDRLPFVEDDSLDIFNELATAVNPAPAIRTITISGDFTPYIWQGQQQTIYEGATPTVRSTLTARSAVFATGTTTITYVQQLTNGEAVGDTVQIDGNYNEQLISRYIYQMMQQLQPCFQMPDDQLGIEENYSIVQKMIIADLVAWSILFRQVLINAEGNAADPNAPEALTRYISSAKAGEVSTNWSYIKMSDSGKAAMNADGMMAAFKANAVCLANQLGCSVEVCADGTIACSCSNLPIIQNGFIVAQPLDRCKNKY